MKVNLFFFNQTTHLVIVWWWCNVALMHYMMEWFLLIAYFLTFCHQLKKTSNHMWCLLYTFLVYWRSFHRKKFKHHLLHTSIFCPNPNLQIDSLNLPGIYVVGYQNSDPETYIRYTLYVGGEWNGKCMQEFLLIVNTTNWST